MGLTPEGPRVDRSALRPPVAGRPRPASAHLNPDNNNQLHRLHVAAGRQGRQGRGASHMYMHMHMCMYMHMYMHMCMYVRMWAGWLPA